MKRALGLESHSNRKYSIFLQTFEIALKLSQVYNSTLKMVVRRMILLNSMLVSRRALFSPKMKFFKDIDLNRSQSILFVALFLLIKKCGYRDAVNMIRHHKLHTMHW